MAGIAETEPVGAIELIAEFGSFEVFAEVREALLEGVEGAVNRVGVGVGDVAPHGKGAGAESGHLAQSAASDGEKVSVGREFVFEQGSKSRGDELRQMADPRAEHVVANGVHVEDARAEAFDPIAPDIRGEQIAFGRAFSGIRAGSASAFSAPLTSLPAMGWPGRNPGWSGRL
jgi:hypothetical protein